MKFAGLRDGNRTQGLAHAQQIGELSGTMHAQPPLRACENKTTIELDSIGGGAAEFARSRSIMRRFCISGVSRQRGMRPTSAQVTSARSASGLPAEVKRVYCSR